MSKKKKIDVSNLAHTLRGESVFFPTKNEPGEAQQAEREDQPPSPPQAQKEQLPADHDTTASRNHDTMTPRNHGTIHDTMTPIIHPTFHGASQPETISEEDPIETIRKAVKQVGKEGGTYRFTLEEKMAMKQIKRYYEDLSIDTSDIEITRIGLNYIVADFRKYGDESILAKVMKRLHE